MNKIGLVHDGPRFTANGTVAILRRPRFAGRNDVVKAGSFLKRFFQFYSVIGIIAILSQSLPVFAIDTAQFPEPPELYAEAAILMDADTGQVLYGKAQQKRMYPASLTKIMTCLLAMENGKYDNIVTVRKEAIQNVAGTTHIALSEGEQLTLEQLLYAMMLESANDAASAIGIHLSGSIQMFRDQMNERAAALGAEGTHFLNANGLPEDNHYSTAYDLALITKEALKHPEFRDFAGTHQYEIPATNNNDKRVVTHKNYMFVLNDTYEGAFAGKTGWTEEAGKCLMTVAERNGITLICIVLKSGGVVDAEFKDSTALFDYGFDHFRRIKAPWSRFPSQQITYTNGAGEELEGRLYPAFDITEDIPILLAEGVEDDDLIPTTFLPQPLTEENLSRIQFELRLPEVAGEVQDRLVGVYPVEVRPLDIQTEIGVKEPERKPFPWKVLGIVLLSIFVVLLILALAAFALAGKLTRVYYRSFFNVRHPQTSPKSEDFYFLSHMELTKQDWEDLRKQYKKQIRIFGASIEDLKVLLEAYQETHQKKQKKKNNKIPQTIQLKEEEPEERIPEPFKEPVKPAEENYFFEDEDDFPVVLPRKRPQSPARLPNRARRPFDD